MVGTLSAANFFQAAAMYEFPIDTLPQVPACSGDELQQVLFDPSDVSVVADLADGMVGVAREMGPGDGYSVVEEGGSHALTIMGSTPGQRVVLSQVDGRGTAIDWHLEAPSIGAALLYQIVMPYGILSYRHARVQLPELAMPRFLRGAVEAILADPARYPQERIALFQNEEPWLPLIFGQEEGHISIDWNSSRVIPDRVRDQNVSFELLRPMTVPTISRENAVGVMTKAPATMPSLTIFAGRDGRYTVEIADAFEGGDGPADALTMSAPFNAFWASAARAANFANAPKGGGGHTHIG